MSIGADFHRGGGHPRLGPDHPPVLLVVVDTEEEFDWNAPFDSNNRSVQAVAELPRLQAIFDRSGVRPVYVVDHPIAANPASAAVFRSLHEAGRAEIGIHLHPWVTPPNEEQPCSFNSYPGNLPPSLERRKLSTMIDVVEGNLGVRARVYKAGRYGLGPATVDALGDLAFEVDLSTSPAFSMHRDGGPDFTAFPNEPYWLDAPGGILEIPTTGGFWGALGPHGARLIPALARWPGLKLTGIFSRLRLLKRARLSPEGFSLEHLQALTRALLATGHRVFTLSLHSPSVAIGHTAYAADADARDRLLATLQGYLDWFLGDQGGINRTATQTRHMLLGAQLRAATAPPRPIGGQPEMPRGCA